MADWTNLTYVVVDVEGNGQQPPDLVELAAVRITGGVIGAHRPSWQAEQDEGQLWTAVERTWDTFVEAGRPARDTIELTVNRGGGSHYRVRAKSTVA